MDTLFSHRIASHRIADEGDLLKMQDELESKMVEGVYVVERSNYLSWLMSKAPIFMMATL
ncbi:hypothetical protein ACMGGR_05425 [Erwinia sp. BNK-24-b]|uniref:hypothetical protein n=1 Tax=unclassified Erwinia TaxID=2622719 RepID=UPI0039BF74E3